MSDGAATASGRPPLRGELLRKAVHVGMGGFALLLRWLGPWQAAACALAALLFNLLLVHRLTGRRLLREHERDRGFSFGIALYPAVVLAAIVVFHDRLELAAAIWGLLAFGDGMATIAGVLVGGPRLPWNRAKSWSGLIAFVLYGTAASAFLLRWTQQSVLDAARAGKDSYDVSVGGSFLAQTVGDAVLPDPLFLLLGCGAACLAAAFAESLETGIDDNLVVPVVGGAVLWAATLVEPSRLIALAEPLGRGLLLGGAVNALFAVGAFAAGGVGVGGAVVGWLLGTALWGLAGWEGFVLLLAFFLLGTGTTRLGFAKKAALGIAQERGGRRGAPNAVANVGAAVLFAFLAIATPHGTLMTIGLVAAFATATCDTVSSEIGQAFGRFHVMVTDFRPVPPGSDGAVSLEGTLAGFVGSAAVAGLALAVGLIGATGAVAVALGGFLGSLAESYLGAFAARARRRVDNELVNFANTLIGALTAIGIYALVS